MQSNLEEPKPNPKGKRTTKTQNVEEAHMLYSHTYPISQHSASNMQIQVKVYIKHQNRENMFNFTYSMGFGARMLSLSGKVQSSQGLMFCAFHNAFLLTTSIKSTDLNLCGLNGSSTSLTSLIIKELPTNVFFTLFCVNSSSF